MAVPTADQLDRVRARLFDDTPYWAEHCAQIVDRRARLVPLVPNSAQLRLDATLEAQRAAGKPMRVIVLKARKLGFSTWVQAKLMHRITQRRFRRALVVAQDNDTAGELFGIGERIWANLPPDKELGLKPPRPHMRRGRSMSFGEPSRSQRDRGVVGLDSSLEVDTANEVEAGRGYTYTELHCSEVAFWPHVEKLTALLNAVPDEPETIVVLESTANGSNHFKTRWEKAQAGESEYVPVFAAWHEDPAYRTEFDRPDDREEFIAKIGEGPFGEDEPRLVAEFGCTPEQLNWRRRKIVDATDSKLELFKQEYPASPEEAFMSSGKHVFSMVLVSRVLDQVRQTDPDFFSPDNPGPELGRLEAVATKPHKAPGGMVDVPTGARWVEATKPSRRPVDGVWRVWAQPDPGEEGERPKGHYIVSIDPAEGEETADGENAFHAIQVIDHRTKRQVAEYRSRIDPDLVALEGYLACLHWNRALFVVERTGGYGLSILRRVWRDFRYPLIYRQKQLDKAKSKQFEDRLGWNTDRGTKPLIEDGIKELLREMPHVFQSFHLASELTTYVKDSKGKTGPEPDAFSDLLMSFGIGQQVAQEWPVPTGHKVSSSTRRTVRNPVTGW